MLVNFGCGIRLHSRTQNPFFSILKPLKTSKQTLHYLPKTLIQTLAMADSSSPDNRRPTCPSCSRPTRVCLCTRFKTPALENIIAVTLLQHSLEKKHPLNSARIATLGLKNVSIAHVSDVISEAHFDIHFCDSKLDLGIHDSIENRKKVEALQPEGIGFTNLDLGIVKNSKKIESLDSADISVTNYDMGHNDIVENHKRVESLESADISVTNLDMGHYNLVENRKEIESLQPTTNLDMGHNDIVENRKNIEALQPADISLTINKRGAITSQSRDFEQLLVDKNMIDCLQNGFTVKRQQRWIDGSYIQEFEIVVPPGSVLLFPSENSIGIENVDFKVKNLIVLDGTWAKATRMYKENPWLRMLPHVKLDMDKLSLYAEVRRQPKARCLSSIESIVYALKAFGKEEDVAGLDCLLDVFKSMIVDQRRCKDERLKSEIDIVSM